MCCLMHSSVIGSRKHLLGTFCVVSELSIGKRDPLNRQSMLRLIKSRFFTITVLAAGACLFMFVDHCSRDTHPHSIQLASRISSLESPLNCPESPPRLKILEPVMMNCRKHALKHHGTLPPSEFSVKFGNCVLQVLSAINTIPGLKGPQWPWYPPFSLEKPVFEPIPLSFVLARNNPLYNVSEFLKEPIVNRLNFSYLHNDKEACNRKEKNVEVIFLIPSAPGNLQRRTNTREGILGKYVEKNKNSTILKFCLGAPAYNSTAVQKKIDEEAKMFNDIIQEDYHDVYKNMSLKSSMMFRWASTYCSKAKLVFRVDDDIILENLDRVVQAARSTASDHHNFLLGSSIKHWIPLRNPCSNNYMSEEEWDHFLFPPAFPGGMIAMPGYTASLLYQATLRTKPLSADDVWITGVCREKIGAILMTHKDFKYHHNIQNSVTGEGECLNRLFGGARF